MYSIIINMNLCYNYVELLAKTFAFELFSFFLTYYIYFVSAKSYGFVLNYNLVHILRWNKFGEVDWLVRVLSIHSFSCQNMFQKQ